MRNTAKRTALSGKSTAAVKRTGSETRPGKVVASTRGRSAAAKSRAVSEMPQYIRLLTVFAPVVIETDAGARTRAEGRQRSHGDG
jgi:hypothetical protein